MPKRESLNENAHRSIFADIVVRQSDVHGRGVYAREPIRHGRRIAEYTGQRLPWKEAMKREPSDPKNPYHTFLFSLDSGDVVDGAIDGNDSRWINHSCDPNCTTRERNGRVYVYALHDIWPGQELFYDYNLVPAERRTKKLEKEFGCLCGSENCRGTMLAPKKSKSR